jgi:hypothetical protein
MRRRRPAPCRLACAAAELPKIDVITVSTPLTLQCRFTVRERRGGRDSEAGICSSSRRTQIFRNGHCRTNLWQAPTPGPFR